MNKKTLWVVGGALLAVGAATAYFVGRDAPAPPEGRHGMGGNGRPVPVLAAGAQRGEIEVMINALGTVTARNTVTVKPRVDGQLLRIAYREGQMVKAGEVLAEIDPRPFQAQLEQANGQLLRDQALLANAQLDVQRYRDLLAKDSIARQQVDAQEALVRQYQGTVQADRGAVDNARLQLDFTRIGAPVAGRLGLRQVDVGNMVRASDATGLVVITQTQPISVVFAIPADSLGAVAKRVQAGESLQVDAWDREGRVKLASGKLLTLDNQIDATTGTVKLKAEFANADNSLFPNQFVNTRLRVETRSGATLVPVAAIQRGTLGTFVYVVNGEEQTVSTRAVTLGAATAELVAIEKGLAPGEQVVVDGADKLRQGAKVEVASPAAREGGGKAPGGPAAGGTPDERAKRWAETNARIERGEFGEEIKKLPEEERKQRMREMRRSGAGGQGRQ
ncbi:MAG: MdtA/MuxA family multidrug efflux RND transporter periplasmic adaptor subunit [Rhodocyclaceae bacterium]